jgi:hypothetical protein
MVQLHRLRGYDIATVSNHESEPLGTNWRPTAVSRFTGSSCFIER